jgi:hypothetical protein
MKKVAGKKMRGPTLQEFELVPITDPAELAAIDRRRKAAEKAMKAAEKAAEKVLAATARNASKRKSRTRK